MHGPAIPPRSIPDLPRIDPSTIGRAYQQAIQEPRTLAGDPRAAHQEPRTLAGDPRSIGRRSCNHSAQQTPRDPAAIGRDPSTVTQR